MNHCFLVYNPAATDSAYQLHFDKTFHQLSAELADTDAIQIIRLELPDDVDAVDLRATDMTDADDEDDGLEVECCFGPS